MNEYTAVEMAGQLADGIVYVLKWVGIAVSAAVLLFLVYLGIYKGFAFFRTFAAEPGMGGGHDAYHDYKSSGLSMDAYEGRADALAANRELGVTMGAEDPDSFAEEMVSAAEARVDEQMKDWDQSRYDFASNFGIDDDARRDYAMGRAVDTYDINGDPFVANAR